jgi:2-hydroxychromene-2-carboxylate isomerase
MAHIEYFFATTSPFTYLAGTRMEEVAARHGATITYRPLDIMALFAAPVGRPRRTGIPRGSTTVCRS